MIIDDFQVPSDPGYRFYTFDGVPLSIDLLEFAVPVLCAFPATPSSEETGARQGAIYIARGVSAGYALRDVAAQGLLTVYEHRQPGVES